MAVIKNLLLAESTVRQLGNRLDEFSAEVQVVSLQADGSLMVNDQSVATTDYPVHLAWLCLAVFRERLAAEFIGVVTGSAELEWLQTISAGLDNPFFRSVLEGGARLSNSDAQAPPIAEYVLASVLYRYQDPARRIEFQKQHQWNSTDFREIYGSHWLVVGFGNIGRRVGRMVRGFDARVTGVKREAGDHKDADKIIVPREIHELLPTADVVVLACALTPETEALVDKTFLDCMKPGSILVNIARGGVVDETALLSALDADQLDYAILDVFQTEPLPEQSRFWDHPRVMVTPHASSRGLGSEARWDELFLQNLRAYLDDEPLQNEVDLTFFR